MSHFRIEHQLASPNQTMIGPQTRMQVQKCSNLTSVTVTTCTLCGVKAFKAGKTTEVPYARTHVVVLVMIFAHLNE